MASRSTPARLQNLCIYASASNAVAAPFFEAAKELGALIARHGLTLVYGGGKVGLMGAVARAVHQHDGTVVGVIPGFLRTVELAYEEADELVVTRDLRERKAVMEARADAFLALPGGFGTLEEIMEALTLKQLRRHDKPVVFLNTANFFGPLLEQFEGFYATRFARPETRALYSVAAKPADVFDYLARYKSPELERKWL